MAESDDDVLAALILDVAELQTAVGGLHVRLREAVAGLSALGDLTTLSDRVAHLEEAGSVAARLENLPSERKAEREGYGAGQTSMLRRRFRPGQP